MTFLLQDTTYLCQHVEIYDSYMLVYSRYIAQLADTALNTNLT